MHKLIISHEEYPLNPRSEWDNLGTMVCFHRRYDLGDKHSYHHEDYSGWDEMRKALEKEFDAVLLPLYLYDHSGITISTSSFSCRRDSGQVGFIGISKAKAREEYGWKNLSAKRIQKLTLYLEGEVETYDQYLTGDVFCFEVQDEEGNFIDACGGFFGSNHKESGMYDHLPEDISAYEVVEV